MRPRTDEQPQEDGYELSDEELDFVIGGREIWFSRAVDRNTVLSSLDDLENADVAS